MRIKPAGFHVVFLAISFLLTLSQLNGQDLTSLNTGGSMVYHPKISFDGTQLVFMSNLDGRAKPYISYLENGAWSTAELLFGDAVNSQMEFQYPQLNYDNTRIYIAARTLEKPDFDIYYSDLIAGDWTKPALLEIGINSEVDELAPAISPNEKRILFTRPLGPEEKGQDFCQKIYSSFQDESGNWSEPKPISPIYNSGCELAPFISQDNKTFYFSSYQNVQDSTGRRISRANLNIFWAKEDGIFQYQPKPLMAVLNADADEMSVSLDRFNNLFYGSGDLFNSNTSRQSSVIRSFTLTKAALLPEKVTLLKGKVLDKNNAPLEAYIDVVDPYTSRTYQSLDSDENGNYQCFVPSGKDYTIIVSKDGYSLQSRIERLEGEEHVSDFELFRNVGVSFNIYDDDYFFQLSANARVLDASYNLVKEETFVPASNKSIAIPLGKPLYVIFESPDYQSDTLRLPFDEEVLFENYEFDIELSRKLAGVDLTFKDDETGEDVELEITIYNVTRNEKITRKVKDGKIHLELREGEEYEISTSAQGYSYYTTSINLKKAHAKNTQIDAQLTSIENTSLVLDNITFEYNSYNLEADSYTELDKLVNYLRENDNFKVEIAAHTDDTGGDEYNLKLSRKRANSVLEYLQDNSILESRLVAVGFGEKKPRYPNDTDENRARNRRVEFKILNSNADK